MNIFLSLIVLFFINAKLFSYNYAADVIVYGSSPAAIMSAIEASRMNASVVLVSESSHLGGMTSNGVSCVDVNDPSCVGGLAREFFKRVLKYYQDPAHWKWEKQKNLKSQIRHPSKDKNTMWVVEPHVAELIFNEMLGETHVQVFLNQNLDKKQGIKKKKNLITQINMTSGHTFVGKVYIDASYEGDLMAAAGVSYTVGRESNSQYSEVSNGIRPNLPLFLKISPYRNMHDQGSGLLARIAPSQGGQIGDSDRGIQAYNYRICMTDNKKNMVPIKKPEAYDEYRYELLFRAANSPAKKPIRFLKMNPIPNGKFDCNHSGPVSTDFVGMSWDYPEASSTIRQWIAREHKNWLQGLIWTLQNHSRIPIEIREYYRQFGLAKDEFVDNEHWPYELYVREARRMVSDFVVTENHLFKNAKPPANSIGIAYYHIDSHGVKYYVDEEGHLRLEGGIFKKIPGPFAISYQAIIPKHRECSNLLVPVCLSASHVAYSSLRMEPIFMILGQSAGAAAALAAQRCCSVQKVPYEILYKRLIEDGQVLLI